jgi:hypothetical protein
MSAMTLASNGGDGGDDPELASYLRIEERELEAGGLKLTPGSPLALFGKGTIRS